VFLWHNGLGPVKAEWGLDFAIMRGQGGVVNFANQDLNLFFSFPMDDSTYHKSGLSSMELIRITFPKYVERPTLFNQAQLVWEQQSRNLDKAEDINAIAFKTLNQRMLLEVGKSILRVALKKASEYQLRKENDDAGALLGIVNALTEQADTRNWQSIPHGIYYTRVSLPEGSQNIQFITKSASSLQASQTHDFTFDIKAGQTIFQTFHSLEMGSQVSFVRGY
jgi:hypothetical protein